MLTGFPMSSTMICRLKSNPISTESDAPAGPEEPVKPFYLSSPKKSGMLKRIENATRRTVEEIVLPSNHEINQKRVDDFKNKIAQTIDTQDLNMFTDLVETTAEEQDIPVAQVAAALAKLLQGNTPFLLKETAAKAKPAVKKSPKKSEKAASKAPVAHVAKKQKQAPSRPNLSNIAPTEKGMERYRIEVGYKHGLKPGDVVGAISNESGLESKFIGAINIDYDYALVDLPFGMPKSIFNMLKRTWIRSPKDVNLQICLLKNR